MSTAAAAHAGLRSASRPLDSATRATMESRVGHALTPVRSHHPATTFAPGSTSEREADRAAASVGRAPRDERTLTSPTPPLRYDFSRVRVHDDGDAAQSADALDAHAYTVGSDIVFGAGRYAPATTAGRILLAHELAHVVQQGGTPQGVQRQPKSTATSANASSQNAHRYDIQYNQPNKALVLIDGVRAAEVTYANAGTFHIEVVFNGQGAAASARVRLTHDGGAHLQPLDSVRTLPFPVTFVEADSTKNYEQLREPPSVHADQFEQLVRAQVRRFMALSPDEQVEKIKTTLDSLRALLSDPRYADIPPAMRTALETRIRMIEAHLGEFADQRERNKYTTTHRVRSLAAVLPVAGTLVLAGGGPEDPAGDVAAGAYTAWKLIAGVAVVSVALYNIHLAAEQSEALDHWIEPATDEVARAKPRIGPADDPATQTRTTVDVVPRAIPKEDEEKAKAYPIYWATQLGPVTQSFFVRTKGARDEDEAKQARMALEWRRFRDPSFDPSRFHVHHVVPLFLGGPDDLRRNAIILEKYLHLKGHRVLQMQPQMANPPAPLPPLPVNMYKHPPGIPYRLVGYKDA